jgi:hypothetical protein
VITVNNVAGLLLTDVSIVDRVPGGIQLRPGSAVLGRRAGRAVGFGPRAQLERPRLAGTQVAHAEAAARRRRRRQRGRVRQPRAGRQRADRHAISGEATATVRVVPDPTFDCTDVIGKVSNDVNRNGVQDDGEGGLPGVRVVTARGLQATTDAYGRYHITCAIVPNETAAAISC